VPLRDKVSAFFENCTFFVRSMNKTNRAAIQTVIITRPKTVKELLQDWGRIQGCVEHLATLNTIRRMVVPVAQESYAKGILRGSSGEHDEDYKEQQDAVNWLDCEITDVTNEMLAEVRCFDCHHVTGKGIK
jgi:hypothetical protein